MKRVFAALLLVLAASGAQAGSLTWTVTTAAGSSSFTANVPDTDIARIIAAGRSIANLTRETSDADVQRALIRRTLDQLIAQTVAYEQQQAAQQAQQAVPAIVATPQQ